MQSETTAARKVLVVSSTVEKASRDKVNGILRYAAAHGPWNVQISDDSPLTRPLAEWGRGRLDGVIVDHGIAALARFKGKLPAIPTVVFDENGDFAPSPGTVRADSARIAAEAAAYLLRRKFRDFAFVGAAGPDAWSAWRAEAFAAVLQQAGHSCHSFAPSAEALASWEAEEAEMIRWLRTLPKPCGMLVAADRRAKQVLDACQAAGIKVPEQLAVVSIDNEADICENTIPTLTSILPDFEGGGYLAAEMLDRLLRGEPAGGPVAYGVKELVERMSSQDLHGASRLVALAGEEIRRRACGGLRVADLARKLNVSRRTLEMRFAEVLGHSAAESILAAKLGRVRELLRENSLRIGEIAARCGFATDLHLKVLFKKRFGLTMSEYRRREAVPEPAGATVTGKAPVDDPGKAPVAGYSLRRGGGRKILDTLAAAGRPLTAAEIADVLGLARTCGHLKRTLRRLRALGLIAFSRPGAPNSRLQRYRLIK